MMVVTVMMMVGVVVPRAISRSLHRHGTGRCGVGVRCLVFIRAQHALSIVVVHRRWRW